MPQRISLATLLTLTSLSAPFASATVVTFFDLDQVALPVNSGITSDTIYSNGYEFTYTRDKLFTGGTGSVIGRSERIHWPSGVEAQAVTTPPPGVTDYKARLTLKRVDGRPFDLTSFTARLLANTAGAGGSIEIMPLLDGEDGFNDPLAFDASGYYWQSFSYDGSPNPWGSTALLKGFDTYKISLYVDFAFTALSLADPSIAGDFNDDRSLDAADIDLLFRAASGVVTPDTVKYDVTGDSQVNNTPNLPGSDADYWVGTLMSTGYGDANLDGLVNFDDLLLLAQNYKATGAGWAMGDADGDGVIDFDDLLVLAQNYTPGRRDGIERLDAGFAADWQLARSLAPEPVLLAGLTFGAAIFRRRRTPDAGQIRPPGTGRLPTDTDRNANRSRGCTNPAFASLDTLS